MTANHLDPLLSLASVMSTTPTSHVVLAGAGMSKTSGMPSAWDVLVDVGQTLAKSMSPEDAAAAGDDIEAWYLASFGTPLRYEDLLEAVAPKRLERQQRLRAYFEPTAAERDAGHKQPTAGHKALARLVEDGFVGVIITLNFDHLIEMALWDLGIQPLVVKSAEELATLPALRFLPPVVVHLHGDYTAAGSMRNTRVELRDYPADAVRWLERVLGEHGLIAAGWSAEYDPALVRLVRDLPTRPFTSYWIEPGDMAVPASSLASDCGIVHVRAGADDAFARLGAAVTSLHERPGRHPLALDVAVATAKRDLSTQVQPVAVHDALRAELARLRDAPELNLTRFDPPAGRVDIDVVYGDLEERCAVAAALIATVVYWGDNRTDDWWLGEIRHMGQPNEGVGGSQALIRRMNLPALLFFYTAGVAALAARRPEVVGRLFNDFVIRSQGLDRRPSQALTPSDAYTAIEHPSKRVFELLEPLFTQQLNLSPADYIEHWETFELLGQADAAFPRVGSVLVLQYLEAVDAIEAAVADVEHYKGTNDIDSLEVSEGSYRRAVALQQVTLSKIKEAIWLAPLHVRMQHGPGTPLHAEMGTRLANQIYAQREGHWVTRAGLFGRSWQVAYVMMLAVASAAGDGSQKGWSNM